MLKKTSHWFFQRKALLLIAILVSFLWCWIFLIDDARLSNSAVAGYLTITLVFLIIVSISVVVFWQTIAYLRSSVKEAKKSWLQIFKIFFVWAFVEFALSWLLALIWMGRNGSWDTTFPFSSFTPYLMWTPLGFLSRFLGYYGLSASIVTGIFVISIKKLRGYTVWYLVAILSFTYLSWSLYAKPSSTSIKTTIVAEQLGSPQKISAADSQFIVLPEYGLDNYTSENVQDRFQTTDTVYFVGSRQLPTNSGNSNTLIFGTNEGFIKEEQKSRLVPGGEYLPFVLELSLRAFAKDTFTNFEVRRSVVKGNDTNKPFVINSQTILGSAACSGIMAPEDYRKLVNQGATVLTNSASLEIFRGSTLFNIEHRGLAKFMAVANARPMLQSSNNWPAFALDQNGKQIAQIQPVGSKQVQISTNKNRTLYTYLGEWPAYIGGLWLVTDLLLKWRRPRIKR